MTSKELRNKFLEYFQSKEHAAIPSASLLPENDPTVLFISAGMQPLVPFLMGKKHPLGNRLVNSQKCIRTDDIDEVGDKVHHTFFEMLGNWSLGDYFKQESIQWSYEFLMSKKYFGLQLDKLAVSVFAGDQDAPFDQESYNKWIELGISPLRIAKLPKKNNWWGPIGETGVCGPDTEIFYWTGGDQTPENFQETCDDPNWVEIWNNVFMEFNKIAEGKYLPLKQKNVDTGMGLERMLSIMNNTDDNYKTDVFLPIISKLEERSGKKYSDSEKEFRIISDHIKAAIFAINDGVFPSNKDAGYVIRRLIRRAVVKAGLLGISENFTIKLIPSVIDIYDGIYIVDENKVKTELDKEETKFRRTLKDGLKKISSLFEIDGKNLFDLYQSFGIPLEVALEEARRLKIKISNQAEKEYIELYKKHQELSRTASAGKFKGGLADTGSETTKLHTAAHLMLAALRQILGDHVFQKGSNITPERLRFDFSYPEKLMPEQIKKVEDLVNKQIEADLPVSMEEMTVEAAKNSGAMGVFDSKYGDKVKVYTIESPSTSSHSSLSLPSISTQALSQSNGRAHPSESKTGSRDFISREICGGPHVGNTGELGHFQIIKEEASSSGVRRIKAKLI